MGSRIDVRYFMSHAYMLALAAKRGERGGGGDVQKAGSGKGTHVIIADIMEDSRS